MSFMFNPHPYDDMSAINRPSFEKETIEKVFAGLNEVSDRLSAQVEAEFAGKKKAVIAFDGYTGTDWDAVLNLTVQRLRLKGIKVETKNIADYYRSSNDIEASLDSYLPNDRESDPVLLFGRLFKGLYEDLCDSEKLGALKQDLENTEAVTIVFGCGAAMESLRSCYSTIVYFDLTPKRAILRAKSGKIVNLGDSIARPYKELLRRCYYVDFELAGHLRWNLIKEKRIDFYIQGDDLLNPVLLSWQAFDEITSKTVRYPFRCRPVYNEGVWGGHYVRKIRGVPESANMKNCAWAFDLIPLEVSLPVQVGDTLIDFPYFTFVQKEGTALMGEQCFEAFDGYFPIRFNYDDTYHSSGNMSIQVHPGEEYVKSNYDEHGRQDESYYVVTAGQCARTFIGFHEGIDTSDFMKKVKESEKKHSVVDYERYINYVESKPGKQFLLPAGTIHSSGQNQVVLEIGSLTVGSYTYKLYDYLRPDLDGKPRPIHSKKGGDVLQMERTADWVKENLVQEPRIIREGEGFRELIVGEHELIYFSLRRLEFVNRIEDDTQGRFHVLVLVNGEQVEVRSLNNPDLFFTQNYLDMVVVPASFGQYEIINRGNQPLVSVHKTHLKDNFLG